ncbi:YqaJ viral recombinase family protein [Guyparkeria sp.]|uniref:YqaJ viral recombinase family nuclease n=1 Tax=Guyparkeria sp. TaxID=2035736 RepID=UPI0039709EBE
MITEEQRRERAAGIGGSDAPIILGLSSYRTAVELWQEKTGQAPIGEDETSEPAHWGNLLEDTVAREFARRTGVRVARDNRTLTHPVLPFMRGHIDRRIVGRRELLEVKTVRALGDEPRPDHVAQVRHYMAVMDFRRAHIAYLIAGQTFKYWTIERDHTEESRLLDAEADFWRCVKTQTPPPVQSLRDWRIIAPADNGQTTTASGHAAHAARELHAIRARIKELEAEAETHQGEIMAAMGEAAELMDTEGRTLATWKDGKPSQGIDVKRLRKEAPEIAERFAVERPAARRFVLKKPQEVPA